MMFIADNQLLLLGLFFIAGVIGTGLLFCRPKGDRIWLFADFVWVVLGGIGALVAVIAGIYIADSSRVDRQIDLAYSTTADFDRDAARFRLTYCEIPSDPQIQTLCDKVDFLSASTAENADLPLFIAITDQVAPLQGLHLFSRAPEHKDGMDSAEMRAVADTLGKAEFVAFDAQDDATRAAISELRNTRPEITADFIVLAGSYDDLIGHVATLQSEWEYLQSQRHILLLQIIALCLVAFAAPFRFGKSITDLR